MSDALTQKKIDALLRRRPTAKREIPDGGQPGLYLVVGPRTLSWIVRFRSPGTGQSVKFRLGDYGPMRPRLTLSEARTAAEAAMRMVREGTDPREGRDVGAETATVEQAFADFVDRYVKRENAASTGRETGAFIRREILPSWGRRRIRSITRHDIIRLLDGIAEDQRDATGDVALSGRPQSAVRVRALLSKAFSWFAAKGVVTENPFRDILVPAAPVARDRVLSDDEIRWLWIATAEVGWPFGELARLLLLTAQRRDEVAASEWSEFALDGDEPQWTIPPERTKNGRRQVLPLSPQAASMLSGLPRVVGGDGKTSPFVLSTNAVTPISGYSRAKARIDIAMLAEARKEADDESLEIAPWTFHDLRRTAASGMASLGIAVHVVEAVLNHKSGQISGVAAIYNRFNYAREKRDALCAWANRIDQIVSQQGSSNVVHIVRTQA